MSALDTAKRAQQEVAALEAAATRARHQRAIAVRSLYGEGVLTQQAIATELGISRALVQAIIEERR